MRWLTFASALVAAAAFAAHSPASAQAEPFCSPGDVSTLIAEQIAFLGGLDPSPTAGNGTAKRSDQNTARFAQLAQRLEDAQTLFLGSNLNGALNSVDSARDRADGDATPPDWLQGAAAATFVDALRCISFALSNGGAVPAMLYVLATPDGPNVVGPQSISAATIGANGSLSLFGTFPTSGEAGMSVARQGLAVSPDRRFVFVSHTTSREVEAFARQADGSLVSTDVLSTAGMPLTIVVHPTLPLIYVATIDPSAIVSQVLVFAYDAVVGAMTQVQAVTTDPFLREITLARNGTLLVAAHISGSPAVAVYSVGFDGLLLSPAVAVDAPTGASRPIGVVADDTGRLYLRDLDAGVFAYDLLPEGFLLPLNGGAAYPTGGLFNADAALGDGVLFVLSLEVPALTPSHLLSFPIEPDGLGSPASVTMADRNVYLALDSDKSTIFMSSRANNWVRSFSATTLLENPGSPFPVPNPAGTTGNLVVSD